MSSGKSMKRNAMILFILMGLSKVLGLVRESFMDFYYGAGMVSDAYLAASRVPNFLFGIIAGGLVSTFIPMYSRISNRGNKKEANDFMNNVLTIIFFMTLVLFAFGMIFTKELVLLNASGFEGEQLQLTIEFTRITLFALLTNGVFSIFNGYSQYEEKFHVQPIAGFIMNIIIISSIVLSGMIEKPILMVYGLVLGSLLQVVFIVITTYRTGEFKYKSRFDLKDQYVKPMFFMALPIIFGTSVSQINGVIDTTMASQFGKGAYSIVTYSSRISDAVFTLFVASITTVMYPVIIKQVVNKEYDQMKSSLTEIMNLIALIIIPATIGLIVLADPVSRLFFKNTASQGNELYFALMGAVVGLLGQSYKDVLVRSFYAFNDMKTPLYASVAQVLTNVVLNFILGALFGVAGLTLATSIASYIGALILYVILNKRMQGLQSRRLLKTISKISVSSIVMGVIVLIIYQQLSIRELPNLIVLGTSIATGGIVYLIGLFLLKVEELHEMIRLVKGKLKIGQGK